ncbi:MAG: hypothetical protein AB7F98_17045 [Novosphingobium sp.]
MRKIAVLLLAAISLTSAAPAQYLRESKIVSINGRQEQWQLMWEGKPRSICGPAEVEMSMTCPCTGFAYGEMGHLSLLRKQGTRTVDRLALGQFFTDLPADNSDGLAAMQWRPFALSDVDQTDEHGNSPPALLARIKARPGPRVMQLADYDHDGVASEFLVQVSAGPCSHTDYIAVGISRANPRLHGLGTAHSPSGTLTMPASAWEALLHSGSEARVTVTPCGDHGSEERQELALSARYGAISATQRTYNCPEDGSKEKLLSSEAL